MLNNSQVESLLNVKQVEELANAVSSFVPKAQLAMVVDYILDENAEEWESMHIYYIETLQTLKKIFETMPKTYDTEQQKIADKVVYLHYFVGGNDWWIIEKDIEVEQLQAFGVTKLGNNPPEFGYISLEELINIHFKVFGDFLIGVELDFNWEPTKIKNIEALASMIPVEPKLTLIQSLKQFFKAIMQKIYK